MVTRATILDCSFSHPLETDTNQDVDAQDSVSLAQLEEGHDADAFLLTALLLDVPPSHAITTRTYLPPTLQTAIQLLPLRLLTAPRYDDLYTHRKPKNARVKRALEAREPKIVENEKTAIFVRGQNTSDRVRGVMQDMVSYMRRA